MFNEFELLTVKVYNFEESALKWKRNSLFHIEISRTILLLYFNALSIINLLLFCVIIVITIISIKLNFQRIFAQSVSSISAFHLSASCVDIYRVDIYRNG